MGIAEMHMQIGRVRRAGIHRSVTLTRYDNHKTAAVLQILPPDNETPVRTP